METDIAIIGAGISGAMLAEELSRHGFSVVILDHRPPFHGSTAASTALLQYEIDVPLLKLRRKIGTDAAAAAWRRSRLSLENLWHRMEDLKIKCQQARHDTLYLAGNMMDADALRDECAARREIGLAGQWLPPSDVKDTWGIARAAILSHGNIAAEPRRMTAGFLRAALERGARLYSPAPVQALEPDAEDVRLHTRDGPCVKARAAISATGYETLRGLYRRRRFRIVSSWAIATRPQPEKLWHGEPHIWEAADPYLYIRTLPDGRVLCGGEDEEFSDEAARDALIPEKSRRLRDKLARLFPHLDTTPTHQWTGCFGQTPTGLPLIGAVPGMRNCYAVMAYGGNGITFAKVAAEILATHLTGGADKDADIFAL